jgi:hypothetical protein
VNLLKDTGVIMADGSLTLRRAAKEIGIHHATLSRWIRLGEGPRAFIKPGQRSCYRIRRIDLDLFLQQNSRGGRLNQHVPRGTDRSKAEVGYPHPSAQRENREDSG